MQVQVLGYDETLEVRQIKVGTIRVRTDDGGQEDRPVYRYGISDPRLKHWRVRRVFWLEECAVEMAKELIRNEQRAIEKLADLEYRISERRATDEDALLERAAILQAWWRERQAA